MSRIGKAPISIPTGVSVGVSGDNVVSVKGPKGELRQAVHPALSVAVADGELTATAPTTRSPTARCTGSTARWSPTWSSA